MAPSAEHDLPGVVHRRVERRRQRAAGERPARVRHGVARPDDLGHIAAGMRADDERSRGPVGDTGENHQSVHGHVDEACRKADRGGKVAHEVAVHERAPGAPPAVTCPKTPRCPPARRARNPTWVPAPFGNRVRSVRRDPSGSGSQIGQERLDAACRGQERAVHGGATLHERLEIERAVRRQPAVIRRAVHAANGRRRSLEDR